MRLQQAQFETLPTVTTELAQTSATAVADDCAADETPQHSPDVKVGRFGVRARLVTFLMAAIGMSISAPSVFAQAEPVDIAKGQQIAQTLCAACHGPDGNSALPVNPNLAGQHPEYLVKQLKAFKGTPEAPAARENAVMAGFAAQLSEADMRNVSAWFASQPLRPAYAEDAELSKIGEQLYRRGIAAKNVPSCAGCHGPTGAGIPVEYPAIAGQHAQYTAAQLTGFRQGTRANNPQMTAIAARLSDKEIAALAEYIAGLR